MDYFFLVILNVGLPIFALMSLPLLRGFNAYFFDARWIDHAGVGYRVDGGFQADGAGWMRFEREPPDAHEFIVRRRTFLDRLVERLWLVGDDHLTGDAEFDEGWVVETGDPSIVDLLRVDAALRARIVNAHIEAGFVARLLEIGGDRQRLWLRVGPPAREREPEALVARFAPLLDAWTQRLRTLPRARRSARWRSAALIAWRVVLVSMAVFGWIGLWESDRGTQLVEPMRFFLAMLPLGLASYFAAIGVARFATRRARAARAIMKETVLVGALACVFGVHAIAREIDFGHVEGPSHRVEQPGAYLIATHRGGSNGFAVELALTRPLEAGLDATELHVSHDIVTGLGLGWPPTTKTFDVCVEYRDGALGYPWVVGYMRLDPGLTFDRKPRRLDCEQPTP